MQVKPAPASCCRKPRVDETDHPVALERLRVLKKIDALRADGLKLRQALKAVELPSSTHHDWRRALAARGVAGLVPKSRRPRRCATPCWTRRDERRVLAARDARPYCGKRRIHHELKRQKAGCDFSVSTVGRILARAVKRGRVRPCSFCRGRLAPKRRRDFSKGHARRWKYGERAEAPGELVQIDHMTVRLDGAELKEFRAVCPFTRRMFARVCSRATAFNARRFFRELLAAMRVVSVQVDGGSEFMAEFEDECEKRGIDLAVLPPQAAAVERLRRTRQRHLPHRVLEPLRRRHDRRGRQRRVPGVPPLLQRRTPPPRHRHDDSQPVPRYPSGRCLKVRNVLSPDIRCHRQLK